MPTKKLHPGFATILILIILGAVILLGTTLFLGNKTSKTSGSVEVATGLPNKETITKTYTNEKFGISILYPFKCEANDTIGSGSPEGVNHVLVTCEEKIEPGITHSLMEINFNTIYMDRSRIVDSSAAKMLSEDPIIIDGYKGTKFKSIGLDVPSGATRLHIGQEGYDILIASKDYPFWISYQGNDTKWIKMADEVVNSIKFSKK